MTTLALTRGARWTRAMAVAGPGLVVMLAARIYTGSLLRMGNRVKLSEALGR